MSYSQKTRKKTCWQVVYVEQPPLSPELNPANFLSVGTLKVLAYSVATEKEETLHQRVSRPVRPFKLPQDLWNCATVHDQMGPCVYLLWWNICWAFLVNWNLVNN